MSDHAGNWIATLANASRSPDDSPAFLPRMAPDVRGLFLLSQR